MIYWLIRIIAKFLCFLPRGLAVRLGRLGGYLFYLFSRSKRAQALKNIRLVFPEKPYAEVAGIARESFKNFGLSLIETLRLPKEIDLFKKKLVIKEPDLFSSLKKRGSILCGIHSGSWELLNSYLASEFPYAIIVKRQRGNAWDRFLNELRLSFGLKIVYEDDLRSLLDYLKRGFTLGVVFDAGFRDSNFYSEFFGKIIPTPTGVLKISFSFQRDVFCGFIRREEAGYTLSLGKPFRVESKESFSSAAGILNTCFENFLREHPFEYLWWYKRFKRAKNLNILVLSDKRAGHTRQSLSLAKLIAEDKKPTSIEVIGISLSKTRRFLLDFCNFFSSPKCFGCFGCLRLILGKDFERVFKYADLVISTGASLSSLNRILAYNLGARSFIVHKPNSGIKKFDLVVLPLHDKAISSKQIVRIKGALSYFSDEELSNSLQELKKLCPKIDETLPKIGIFVGGPLGKVSNKEEILKFFRTLKEISLRNSWQFFLTTSFRTPSFLEEFLDEEFKEANFLIIARKRNYPFVSLGIIALCDVILVSSDSVSMITEAASVKPTLVFDVFRVKKKKHQRFIQDLSEEKHIRLIDEKNLEDEVKLILNKEIVLNRIDNLKIIKDILSTKL